MPAAYRTRGRVRRAAALIAATLVAALPAVAPAQGMSPPAPPPSGYWLVASDGGIFTFGDARFHGSTGDIHLNKPIVGMAPTPTGNGYWLVASDGGIFSYGDARFHGSTGDIHLNKPIVGMAPTATGNGYWLVASDGGVFSYGDARFHGAAAMSGSTHPIISMRPTPTGKGYWQANAAGRMFAFGDAVDYGSTGDLNVPAVSMAPSPTGAGYWLTGRDGGIFSFGDARFFGSTGAITLNQPIVGMAPLPYRPAPPATGTGPTTVTTGPAGPGSSTTTTTKVVPHQAAAHPADPDGNPPEAISGPFPDIRGGTSYTEVSSDPNVPHSSPEPWNVTPASCGFPERARLTQLPDDTDYIGEGSGLVASRKYPGSFWLIRDSGHTPAINLIRFDDAGYVTTREFLVDGARNGDWEDIAYTIGPDGRGRIWVIGNGGRGLTSTGATADIGKEIYEILEPDPDMAPNGVDHKERPTTTVAFENVYRWAYPDANANTEAAFMSRGYLVVVTKTEPHARMYRFTALNPGTVNEPEFIGELGGAKSVSVVRQSPDGRTLIAASHQQIRLYRSTDGSGSIKSFSGRLPDCEFASFPDQHVEAGDFISPSQLQFVTEIKRTIRLDFVP